MAGRFDALTQLDKKTMPTASPQEKAIPLSIEKNQDEKNTNLPANLQARKQVNLQASIPVNQQTRLPANLQAGKQVNLQTGGQIMIEKYSSYLPHEYKRELKRIAFETDRNEYEVLIEAVEKYLEKQEK